MHSIFLKCLQYTAWVEPQCSISDFVIYVPSTSKLSLLPFSPSEAFCTCLARNQASNKYFA